MATWVGKIDFSIYLAQVDLRAVLAQVFKISSSIQDLRKFFNQKNNSKMTSKPKQHMRSLSEPRKMQNPSQFFTPFHIDLIKSKTLSKSYSTEFYNRLDRNIDLNFKNLDLWRYSSEYNFELPYAGVHPAGSGPGLQPNLPPSNPTKTNFNISTLCYLSNIYKVLETLNQNFDLMKASQDQMKSQHKNFNQKIDSLSDQVGDLTELMRKSLDQQSKFGSKLDAINDFLTFDGGLRMGELTELGDREELVEGEEHQREHQRQLPGNSERNRKLTPCSSFPIVQKKTYDIPNAKLLRRRYSYQGVQALPPEKANQILKRRRSRIEINQGQETDSPLGSRMGQNVRLGLPLPNLPIKIPKKSSGMAGNEKDSGPQVRGRETERNKAGSRHRSDSLEVQPDEIDRNNDLPISEPLSESDVIPRFEPPKIIESPIEVEHLPNLPDNAPIKKFCLEVSQPYDGRYGEILGKGQVGTPGLLPTWISASRLGWGGDILGHFLGTVRFCVKKSVHQPLFSAQAPAKPAPQWSTS